MAGVPRAAWIGGGLLCVVTAALAGALVMKSVSPSSNTPVAATSPAAVSAVADPAQRPGTPLPLAANDSLAPARAAPPVPESQPVPAALPKPTPAVRVAQNRAAGAYDAPAPERARPVAVCQVCGTVESVRAIKVKGQGTGVGAVAGGVLGGVVGHQLGGGTGKTALTILGAVGGVAAGHEVEKRARGETVFDVSVRMNDGSHRVVRQNQSVAIGTRVTVEGSTLRIS
jgi:outer membrane lipoprotein SlyB